MTSYPPDLLKPIRDYVERLDMEHSLPRHFPLPSDPVLTLFLDQAYHASFQTEEGRTPGFRVILASEEELASQWHLSPEIPRSRLIRLGEPRPFTAAEITRLAPAAEHSRSLICVRDSSNNDEPSLEIWGILDIGESWWKSIHHETSGGRFPPNLLTVASVAPGELSLSAAGVTFLELESGSIVDRFGGALSSGPVADHLSSAGDALYTEAVRRVGGDRWDTDGADEEYPKRLYISFLERVLFGVRARAHGGTVLLIPDALGPGDTRVSDRVAIKYPCLYDHAWSALIARLVNQRQYYDLHFSPSDGTRELNAENFAEHDRLSYEGDEIDECLADIAQSIAALTAVDGAVVMTSHYRVFGFGAEVICPSPSLETVKVADSGSFIPISALGTRHRAAFRFCSTFEDAIAFVASHDGGLKIVKRVGPDVVIWRDIKPGMFGLWHRV